METHEELTREQERETAVAKMKAIREHLMPELVKDFD
jgi:hypothetical protein